MLKNALFYLVQSEMVFVELFFCIGNIEIVFCIFIPGQVEKCLQIVVLHRIVWSLWLQTFKFAHLLFECVLDILIPQFLLGSLIKLVNIVLVGVSKLILNCADLLLKKMCPLLLGNIFLCS